MLRIALQRGTERIEPALRPRAVIRERAPARAVVGAAVAATLLAGCDSSGKQADGEVTVVERAMAPLHGGAGGDGGPGATGGDGVDGGDGGDGGDATSGPGGADGVDGRSSDVEACITRFDGLDGNKLHRDWSGAHKSAVIDILLAVQRHLGTTSGSTADALEAGLVADTVDTEHNRLILVVDPGVLDLAQLRSYAEATAKKANTVHKTRGVPVTVAVHESCFPSADLARVRHEVQGTPKLAMSADVRVDSRVHAAVCSDDPAYAKEIERRYAPMAVVGYAGACVQAR